MGYTLGYALKNPRDIPEINAENMQELQAICVPEPKKKKRKDTPEVASLQPVCQFDNNMQIAIAPSNVQNTPRDDPEENLVQIPNEYDFDVMALVADIQDDDMEYKEENQNFNMVPPQMNTTNRTSTNTQINVTKNPDMPSFAHCQIGTINFNFIKK